MEITRTLGPADTVPFPAQEIVIRLEPADDPHGLIGRLVADGTMASLLSVIALSGRPALDGADLDAVERAEVEKRVTEIGPVMRLVQDQMDKALWSARRAGASWRHLAWLAEWQPTTVRRHVRAYEGDGDDAASWSAADQDNED